MKTVAFVPIKLRSQRLKEKNILPLSGHPLCWHICNTLNQVKDINETYVFCSEERVKEYLPQTVRFLQRDKKLDGDMILGEEIYASFINLIDADIYILAHTTSPFILPATIEDALFHVMEAHDSAFSAERIQTFAWYQGRPLNYDLEHVARTQEIEPVWVETSGFYIFRKEIFTKYHRRIGFRPYVKEVSGREALDIDERKDYEMALQMEERQEWRKN